MSKGYFNEIVFINSINNKKYKETNLLIQELLRKLYPRIKENDLIIAYKYGQYAKVDIVICVNNIKKGLSLKTGDKNSVHLEKIYQFCNYIKKYGFKEIENLKRYLYSDGTTNNTGKERISAKEYQKIHYSEIKKINIELNNYKHILINRFLIKSDINYKVTVDAFIYGEINDFIWATKEEVLDYLINKNFDSNGIHISSLFLQNWDKNLKYNPKYEKCREYIQVKWFSLFDDIIAIMCKRNMVEPHNFAKADCLKNKKKNSIIIEFLKNIWSG